MCVHSKHYIYRSQRRKLIICKTHPYNGIAQPQMCRGCTLCNYFTLSIIMNSSDKNLSIYFVAAAWHYIYIYTKYIGARQPTQQTLRNSAFYLAINSTKDYVAAHRSDGRNEVERMRSIRTHIRKKTLVGMWFEDKTYIMSLFWVRISFRRSLITLCAATCGLTTIVGI